MIDKCSEVSGFGGIPIRRKLQPCQPEIREILFSFFRGHVDFINLLNNLEFIPKNTEQF